MEAPVISVQNSLRSRGEIPQESSFSRSFAGNGHHKGPRELYEPMGNSPVNKIRRLGQEGTGALTMRPKTQVHQREKPMELRVQRQTDRLSRLVGVRGTENGARIFSLSSRWLPRCPADHAGFPAFLPLKSNLVKEEVTRTREMPALPCVSCS